MKASQKLTICFEQLKTVQRFADVDLKLLPLIAKLEAEGDLFGPAFVVIYAPEPICVSASYFGKARGPSKPKLFGYDENELMKKQY
jgi:hypothetical protein